jgi:hypothetical protein
VTVEHTFITKLEPIEAFGISNELLRPRGFTLEEGNPSRSQQWSRAGSAKARSVTRRPQSLRMEHDRGRVSVHLSMEVAGQRAAPAQRLMMAYARALEALLVERKPVETAAAGADSVERGIRGAERKSILVKCTAAVALLIGAGVAIAFATDRAHPFKEVITSGHAIVQAGAPPVPPPAAPLADPRIQVTVKPADPTAAKKKSPPVITVRRAGTHPQAAAKSGD